MKQRRSACIDSFYAIMETATVSGTVTKKGIGMTIGELLEDVQQLDATTLETFADEVLLIRAKRRAPSLSTSETELLRRINQSLPAHVRVRFQKLKAKRQAETLTETEHAELLDLVDQLEAHDVERLENLAKLAQLRNLPVRKLMHQYRLQRIL